MKILLKCDEKKTIIELHRLYFAKTYHNLVKGMFYSLFKSISSLALVINLRCFNLYSDKHFEEVQKCMNSLFLYLGNIFPLFG